MFVVTLWVDSGCSFSDGEYVLDLASQTNDTLNIGADPDSIIEAVEEWFSGRPPAAETVYEIHLERFEMDPGHGFIVSQCRILNPCVGGAYKKVDRDADAFTVSDRISFRDAGKVSDISFTAVCFRDAFGEVEIKGVRVHVKPESLSWESAEDVCRRAILDGRVDTGKHWMEKLAAVERNLRRHR